MVTRGKITGFKMQIWECEVCGHITKGHLTGEKDMSRHMLDVHVVTYEED